MKVVLGRINVMLLENIKTTERQGVCEHDWSERPVKRFRVRHG